MHDTSNLAIRLASTSDGPAAEYFHHSSAQRVDTDAVIIQAIEAQYPNSSVVIVPESGCNLLAYAASGRATAVPLREDRDDSGISTSLKWRRYVPPSRRIDGAFGVLVEQVRFGKYQYTWRDHVFFLYVVDGRDGGGAFPHVKNNYIIGEEKEINQLISWVGQYDSQLHDEVWVFYGGFWQKDAALYQSVQKSSWDDVILDKNMKRTIRGDVERFFNSRSTYAKLRVPWKRGVIYHGPPGNGKTISIKAMMHSLYSRLPAVPTLYGLNVYSYAGPEASLHQIFSKARQEAPCLLVFEDLDSIVTDGVRSFFLNEVDGLSSNDGILMLGSTNHLDRLDPGISKRPSRFDRKYLFPDPDLPQRVQYAEYWRGKLSENEEIQFPTRLCGAIARITDGFSFAYMQEAFVATLLAIAARDGEDDESGDDENEGAEKDEADRAGAKVEALAREMDLLSFWYSVTGHPYICYSADKDLDQYVLWREIKKQVKILRDEMTDEVEKIKVGIQD
ncbi:MAG: hypothetical protein M1819_004703 [Sarea resinae]|nr:MAG: hypothetical protein M1819_004703 [Sarea resinae]